MTLGTNLPSFKLSSSSERLRVTVKPDVTLEICNQISLSLSVFKLTAAAGVAQLKLGSQCCKKRGLDFLLPVSHQFKISLLNLLLNSPSQKKKGVVGKHELPSRWVKSRKGMCTLSSGQQHKRGKGKVSLAPYTPWIIIKKIVVDKFMDLPHHIWFGPPIQTWMYSVDTCEIWRLKSKFSKTYLPLTNSYTHFASAPMRHRTPKHIQSSVHAKSSSSTRS